MWLKFTKADVLGEELVENGDFATDSDWLEGVGWDIDTINNKATCDGTQTSTSTLTTSVGIPIKDLGVLFSFKISNYLSGTLTVTIEGTGGQEFTNISGDDTYSVRIISGDNTPKIIFTASTDFEGSISNVTVKEVAQFIPDKSTNTNNAKLFTGKALEFNGNDHVNLGTTFGLTGEFTVAFWVNLTNYASAVIVGDSANEDWFRIESATEYTLKLNNASSIDVVSGGKIPLASWNRVALIRDSNNLVTLSINGIIYANHAPTRSGDFDFIYLGLKDSTRFMSGLLSDVQIYNKAWTSDDAAYDYANPNNLVIDNPNTNITLSNSSAYYALSEGSGNVIFDSTGSGAELVTNGDFADGSGWDLSGVWSLGTNKVTYSDNANGDIRTSYHIFTATKTYQIKLTVSGLTGSNTAFFAIGDGNSNNLVDYDNYTNGDYTFNATAPNGNELRIYSTTNSGSSYGITNISVKEAKAYDGRGVFLNGSSAVIGATWVHNQPTIPQLGMMDWSKGSNLFANSQVFSAWIRGDTSLAANNVTSPIGDLTGSTLTTTSTGSTFSISSEVVASTSYTFSFYVKRGTMSDLKYRIYDNSNTNNIVAPTSYYSETKSTGWVKVSKTFHTPSGCTSVRTYIISDSASTGTVLIWGSQLEQSSTSGSYIGTSGGRAINATLIQNPNDIGKDVLGNALRLRDGGFNLDGIGYAEVVDDASLAMTEGFSVGFWTKLTPEASGIHQTCIAKGAGLGTHANNGMAISMFNNKIYFDINASTRFSINSPAQTMDNSWLFVTATYTKLEKIRLYLNDSSPIVDTTNLSGTIYEDYPVTIGTNKDVAHKLLSQIDETIWYDRPLSAKEILNNYKAGLSKHKN